MIISCHVLDIYICCVSYSHNVAAKDFFLAMVSTTVETKDPNAELEPGLKLLGPIEEKFTYVQDVFEPIDDGSKSKVRLLETISILFTLQSCAIKWSSLISKLSCYYIRSIIFI